MASIMISHLIGMNLCYGFPSYREGPWLSGYSSSVMVQIVAVKLEFEARLCHAMTGNPAVNGYLFRIREG